MHHDILDVVLLLALPASGKSEVRKFLKSVPPDVCRRDFHLGPTVQLDDFPYVHIMRRVDEILTQAGNDRLFFLAPDRSFRDPRDWGTLVHMVNEDYEDLRMKNRETPVSAGTDILDRLDRAGGRVGIPVRFGRLPARTRQALADGLEREARDILEAKHREYPETLEGRTLVLEFARGGPDGATMPLPDPLGYRYSLGRLSETILTRAVILYVWVTPEESRRKNRERADPNDPGSILHHSVPTEVMMNDYGVDDMDWLEANAERKGTVTLAPNGHRYHVPVARFDNRRDLTSFLRSPASDWSPEDARGVHENLKEALAHLHEARKAGGDRK